VLATPACRDGCAALPGANGGALRFADRLADATWPEKEQSRDDYTVARTEEQKRRIMKHAPAAALDLDDETPVEAGEAAEADAA
jgi:hypothetical protein